MDEIRASFVFVLLINVLMIMRNVCKNVFCVSHFLEKVLLILCAFMLSSFDAKAQEAELQKIHDVLNTVEQKYMRNIKVNPSSVTITIGYIQELENVSGNMFSDNMEANHFPLPVFIDELDYSNPFPGFPNKPKMNYTLTISQQSIVVKMQDKDILLHGDLDNYGNDKAPVNPFTRVWKCKPGTVTLKGLVGIPNRKLVEVSMTNTCSHSHRTLSRSGSTSYQYNTVNTILGKVKVAGQTDYYPTHKYDHSQTTTYSIPNIMKAAGYNINRFIYEMLNGGLYYVRTNEQFGDLRLLSEDRLCTIYAIWKVFGMTDEKYRQIYKSFSSNSSVGVQKLDADYKEAMRLYKEKEYLEAHKLYVPLRDAYEKLMNSNVPREDYKLYAGRTIASTFRKVYSALKSKSMTHDQIVQLIADADAMTEKYKTNFVGIPDFYKNAADFLVECNEFYLAWKCYLRGYNFYSNNIVANTPEQECLQMDCLLEAMEIELDLTYNGIVKDGQHKVLRIMTDESFHYEYDGLCNMLRDRSKREYYTLRWYDVWVVTCCKQSKKAECKRYLNLLLSQMSDTTIDRFQQLKNYKCYNALKEKYPDLLME